MKSNVLKNIINSYVLNDDQTFIKSFMQLAAQEERAGHKKIAEELKTTIEQFINSDHYKNELKKNTPANIVKPSSNLAELLSVTFSNVKLNHIILKDDLRKRIKTILSENLRKNELAKWGVEPSRKLLLYGPPGCGKTLMAQAIANELKLPLLTVNFASLISKYLGSTASQLQQIFTEIVDRPGVYLFDEFDAIGKHRNDSQEVGEIKRVVTSFLQLMDNDKSTSLIIAATNYEESLDYALFRRFDEVLEFKKPTNKDIINLIELKLALFKLPKKEICKIVSNNKIDLSYADVARACDNAIKNMILSEREDLLITDLELALNDVRNRFKGSKNK
jgi:AAA+ superfamily predicted ATPase